MLSRRSVRIKVMQLLFSLNRDRELTYAEAEKQYQRNIDLCFEAYLFNLDVIVQITKQAITDARKRRVKHLPTAYDKSFTSKLYKNPLIQNLVNNANLQHEYRKLRFDKKKNVDYVKKIYNEFSREDVYILYVRNDSGHKEHLEILLELYRFCRQHEFFNEILEDNFTNWPSDKSIIIGSVKKTLKVLPDGSPSYYKELYPDDETVNTLGRALLKRTYEEDKVLLEYIKPTLENWDYERLAVIDMILIKMAMCEFLFFNTVPTKVSMNEYLEISKLYSTPKSKEFINGILDRLLSILKEEGKVNKEGRGLLE